MARWGGETFNYKFYMSIFCKILYMDLLAPYLIADSSKFNEEVPITFNIEYQKFLENTPKRSETSKLLYKALVMFKIFHEIFRVLANYVSWRIIQASLPFVDKDLRNIGEIRESCEILLKLFGIFSSTDLREGSVWEGGK